MKAIINRQAFIKVNEMLGEVIKNKTIRTIVAITCTIIGAFIGIMALPLAAICPRFRNWLRKKLKY